MTLKENKIENQLTNDFNKKFENLNIKGSKNLYVTSNLTALGKLRIKKEKKLDIIFKSLIHSMGSDFSIFSPAATMNLCNTSKIFDLEKTPSFQMGPLAEHIRLKESIRSIHPYWSICGVGKYSNLLNNVSAHAYGVGSPWSIMLDLDTLQVNLGIHPSKAVTLIHHIETIVGVPYRYNKEFSHKIKIKNKIFKGKFYLSARFKKIKILKKKKLNEHFFQELKKRNKIKYEISNSGLEMWSFKMKDFYDVAIEMFKQDIFTYLEYPPLLKLDI